MPGRIKNAVRRTVGFVEDHPTLTVGVITAVATTQVSYRAGYRQASDETLEAAVEVVYEMGKRSGRVQAVFDTAMDFLVDNDMLDKFKTDTGIDVVKNTQLVDMVA